MTELLGNLAPASTLRKRFSRCAFTVLGVVILLCIPAVYANAAGCAPSGRQDDPIALPESQNSSASAPVTVIGLWQVTYTTSSKTSSVCH